MTKYPLLFTFRDKIEGRDFVAEVVAHGRVLAVEEQEGWWLYGVQPGDLAESGTTAQEAVAAFRKTFTEILLDIVTSVTDVSALRDEVQRWFAAVNEPTEREWREAVEEVRAGRVTAELQKESAESPRWVEVVLLKKAAQPLALDPPMALAA